MRGGDDAPSENRVSMASDERGELEEGDRDGGVSPWPPLALPAAMLAAGILIDRHFSPMEARASACLAAACALLAIVFRARLRVQHGFLLLCFLFLGAAWHHVRWSDLPPRDLARSIDETPRPTWLRGVLADRTIYHPPEGGRELQDEGYTSSVLVVTGLCDGQDWHEFTGRAHLVIGGDRTDLRAGDPIWAAGMLSAITGPTNPGESDRRDRFRADGIRLRMSVADSISVGPGPERSAFTWTRWLGRARAWCHDRLGDALGTTVTPLASALLLGRREAIDPDVNDAFARTGTTHLLAISGLHLQAMALIIGGACLLAGAGHRTTHAVILMGTLSYATLVGWMPSVARSATMTCLFCLSCLLNRPSPVGNLMAAALIATLALNPSDLFDVGCQLSFLSVSALIWAVPWALGRAEAREHPLDRVERLYWPRWRRVVHGLARAVGACLVASAIVWLVTWPLVALRFHLVSPIGIILNFPLIPITSLALGLCTLTLALSSAWLPLAAPFAWACRGLLEMSQWFVMNGERVPFGHFFVPGPPVAWVLGFYGLLAVLAMALSVRWRRVGWAWGAMFAWVVGLGVVWLRTTGPAHPEVETFDVGHGLATLIHAPSGRAYLYDCGRMHDPQVGRRVIAPALWERGITRIDGLFLSHPDADHVNGLPDVLDRFHVRAVMVPPAFLTSDDLAIQALMADIQRRGVPVRVLQTGDRIPLDEGLVATVLNPCPGGLLDAPDNDQSVVLDLDHRGRHLLLTGDVDGYGQDDLVLGPRPPIDVMFAPHHGGRTANPPRLYDWAQPAVVVVSQRRPRASSTDPLEMLARRGTRLHRTWADGAVRVVGGPDGWRIGGPPVSEAAEKPPDFPWALALVLVLAGLLAGLAVGASVLAVEIGAWFLVRPGDAGPHANEPPPWETITATAPDGTRLAGSWRSPVTSAGGTVVLLHGLAEDRSALLGRAEAMVERGWNAALLDHRGCGHGDGRWVTYGLLEVGDLRAWLDHLSDRVGPSFLPVVWGRSMGAAVALRAVADDPRPRAVVIEAPYDDLRASVALSLRRKRLPAFLARLMLWRARRIVGGPIDRPSPVELAARVSCPVLILHGADDRVAPTAQVERLAAAFPTPPERIEITGAGHADVFDVGGPQLADHVAGFLHAAPIPARPAPIASGADSTDPPAATRPIENS
jgi:competence protein ComEC